MAGHAHAATRSLNGSTRAKDSPAVDDSAPVEESFAAEDYERADEEARESIDDDVEAAVLQPASRVRLVIAAVGAIVIVLGCLVGWLGYRTYEVRQVQAQHDMLLNAARQGAVDLTTFGYETTDADIQRILNATTGSFHDDFQSGSGPFVAVIKQAQSKSEGTVTEAGVESLDGDHAQVLLAVSVKTTNAGVPEQEPRAWRMRIGVQKVDGGAKVSSVAFVP